MPLVTMRELLKRVLPPAAGARRAGLKTRCRPRLEALEDRRLLAVFTVTNSNDSGPGSFRQALLDANLTADLDQVEFNIPGPVPHSIQVLSALPVVSRPIEILGNTQPGFLGTPVVGIDGSSTPPGVVNGLDITAGGSTVRSLVISLFSGTGLVLRTAGNNQIVGNYIGTNFTGTLSRPNQRGGMSVTSNDNRIGGATTADRNVVSGNLGTGITLTNASRNRIQGNFLGTQANGAQGMGNGNRGLILVGNSQSNIIGTDGDGTDDVGERNVVSGNSGAGILLQDANNRLNVIAGNYVGTDVQGALAIPNGTDGIGLYLGAQQNRIGTNGDGTSDDVERNVISGNQQSGIQVGDANTSNNVIAGNYIGLNAAGAGFVRNGQQGILLINGPRLNRIGTDGNGSGDLAERNVISGNGFEAIALSNATANTIAGNFLGINAAGTAALGNLRDGIYMANRADGNVIGTNSDNRGDEAERNVIAGNSGNGIGMHNVRNVRVAGNYIGTNAAGTAGLGNGRGCNYPGCSGVAVVQGSQSNFIGTNGDGQNDVGERNVIAANASNGVLIADSTTILNVVAGNYVGTDANGTRALPNGWHSIEIFRAARNRIGTDSNGIADAEERNVLGVAFLSGVSIFGVGAADNTVAGNYIGTDVAGEAALGVPSHLYGVQVWGGAVNNLIGGTATAARNVISGNTFGVALAGTGTTNNRVFGNVIGTRADGTTPLRNHAHGVYVFQDATGNRIGGGGEGEGNVIAFNGGSGVVVASGVGIAIRGNSIHGNVGLGIDLAFDGVTLNDAQDTDTGPNELQNFPELLLAWGGKFSFVVATLNSRPDTSFMIDFYASASRDSTGYGQGQRYLGSVEAVTDANGDAVVLAFFLVPTSVGEWVTATATDPAGNTSEFSAAMQAEPFAGPHGGGPGSFSGTPHDGGASFGLAVRSGIWSSASPITSAIFGQKPDVQTYDTLFASVPVVGASERTEFALSETEASSDPNLVSDFAHGVLWAALWMEG